MTSSSIGPGEHADPPAFPEDALVVLIGPAAAGKSTWARDRFPSTAILSSDGFRAMVSDDEADQSASEDAFELLELAARKRLARGRFTVVDATNLEPWVRFRFLDLAAAYRRPVIAVLFDLPLEALLDRNAARTSRTVSRRVIVHQARQMRHVVAGIGREGYAAIHVVADGTRAGDARASS